MVEALRKDDEYGPSGSSGSPGEDEPKYNVSNIAGRAKQQMGQGMAKAGEEVERGKDELAEVLDNTAQRLESTQGEPDSMRTKARLKAANGLESTATYLRDHNLSEIDKDALNYVRKHPFHIMGVFVITSILIRRMMR